jgi:hypothetical protein
VLPPSLRLRELASEIRAQPQQPGPRTPKRFDPASP